MSHTQTPLVILPLQWAALPELHDTPLLDKTDHACMAELQTVLARHGKLGRFALHLAHRHLELEPGEVLIERPDPDGRTQHVTVGRLADEPDARPTTWLFSSDDASPSLSAMPDAIYCVCIPVNPALFGGCAAHGRSSSPSEKSQKEEAAKSEHANQENAKYERGGPVAGHDFEKEREEDRER